MIDPNRLNRVHVANVRMRGEKFYIVLSDKTEIEWTVWIKMSEQERWNQ